MLRVHVLGADHRGWAIDEDRRLTERALRNVVELTGLDQADVVHAVWWESLADVAPERLRGKRVVCHFPGEPYRFLSMPAHRHVLDLIQIAVARSGEAARELRAIGVDTRLIPYTVDPATFRPLPPAAVAAARARLALPEGVYLVGNFHRDTEGSDLRSPKMVKGPDVFLEVVRGLHERDRPVHVLLAGPRRFWIRRQLERLGIPHTFVGEEPQGDDIDLNILPRETLNELYNLLDLCLVSSRSEGGPQALMEAPAAARKVLSTPVGLAGDILEPDCIYSDPARAVEAIAADMEGETLAATIEPQRRRVLDSHTPDAVAPLFASMYGELARVSRCTGGRPRVRAPAAGDSASGGSRSGLVASAVRLVRRWSARRRARLRVGIWHEFREPPWGGGNQFMLALRNALRESGVAVRENRIGRFIDVYLLNSIHFDIERFQAARQRGKLRAVHRIDGPIHLIRGFDREKDELAFRLNAELADSTVVQSAWTLERIVEMGYRPVAPVIIHNAVDSDVFHAEGRAPFARDRRIRLISTSWSSNPRKGGPIYRWLDRNLDWDRYEYTFVGRVSEPLERIRVVDPLPSNGVASLLREHDIYITASRNDPCSNALVEALSCGLPALYMDDGGHPELVGFGGLPFDSAEEVPAKLERLVAHYEMYQRLISAPRMEEVAARYLQLLDEAAE